jgi:MYXO-CTERM domain-containing protein
MSDHPHAEGAIPPEPHASGRPHDVLAAEQFAMPAPEAAWHRERPLELPPEPNASDEPHDVLAAEEFAMPAPPPHVQFAAAPTPAGRPTRRRFGAAAGLGALLALLLRRRRRSR